MFKANKKLLHQTEILRCCCLVGNYAAIKMPNFSFILFCNISSKVMKVKIAESLENFKRRHFQISAVHAGGRGQRKPEDIPILCVNQRFRQTLPFLPFHPNYDLLAWKPNGNLLEWNMLYVFAQFTWKWFCLRVQNIFDPEKNPTECLFHSNSQK